MELAVEPRVLQRALERVDTIRDEEHRPFLALREEVPHRSIERSRQAHGDPVHGHERKGAVDAPDGRRIAAEHAAAGLLEIDVVQQIQSRVEQIDDAIDGSFHRRIVSRHVDAS
jgi:hypothetical protein